MTTKENIQGTQDEYKRLAGAWTSNDLGRTVHMRDRLLLGLV